MLSQWSIISWTRNTLLSIVAPFYPKHRRKRQKTSRVYLCSVNSAAPQEPSSSPSESPRQTANLTPWSDRDPGRIVHAPPELSRTCRCSLSLAMAVPVGKVGVHTRPYFRHVPVIMTAHADPRHRTLESQSEAVDG